MTPSLVGVGRVEGLHSTCVGQAERPFVGQKATQAQVGPRAENVPATLGANQWASEGRIESPDLPLVFGPPDYPG